MQLAHGDANAINYAKLAERSSPDLVERMERIGSPRTPSPGARPKPIAGQSVATKNSERR